MDKSSLVIFLINTTLYLIKVAYKLVIGNSYKIPPIPIDNLCIPTAALHTTRGEPVHQVVQWFYYSTVMSSGNVMERGLLP